MKNIVYLFVIVFLLTGCKKLQKTIVVTEVEAVVAEAVVPGKLYSTQLQIWGAETLQ
ncbi:MAG: hypothetical protein IPL84_17715 [Chitinophagaceae bacterium]|nr:hypothetical protein [Chitinophagaceae bacterium]